MRTRFLLLVFVLFAHSLAAQTWIPSDYKRFTQEEFLQLAAVYQTIN
ncbi:hypothetical protein [Algoriphagus winogradskyi]|nr:hypothetical protein [Algoriphagus winogradskyi]